MGKSLSVPDGGDGAGGAGVGEGPHQVRFGALDLTDAPAGDRLHAMARRVRPHRRRLRLHTHTHTSPGRRFAIFVNPIITTKVEDPGDEEALNFRLDTNISSFCFLKEEMITSGKS